MTILIKPDFKFLLAHPAHFIAFGFGAGLAPKAPGTWGSLLALPLFALLLWLGLDAAHIAWLTLPLFMMGIPVCGVTGRALGVGDHGGIVWDEIVAMLLVLAFAPASIGGWILAFVLFRLFDIFKPWPIRWFDRRIHGGFGVMLDDLIAAVFAIAVQALLLLILPVFF
ncbi:phosphatidylglycerophosphatase A family protein [Craterilacuibacter sp.]|uniref:phosphatidylglycerophosphatase A family protein n=1 Tax=Craterilacuibacter sp. TaxID=2870909 RepID=UPI003F2F0A45